MAKVLSIEKPVDDNFKVVKDSDGTSTALELSANKVKANNLEVAGETTGLLLPIDEPIQFQNGVQVSTIKSYNTNDFEIRAARDLDIVSHREIVLDTATESGDAIYIKAATDITLDADGSDVFIKNDDSLGFQFRTIVGNGSYLNIFERGGTTEDDKFQLRVLEHGATDIFTIDDASNNADFNVDIDGDITLDSATGTITLLDNGSTYTPSASSDVANKGYVDTTQYTLQVCNYASVTTSGKIYLPFSQLRELTGTSGGNEYITFVAPFTGTLEAFHFRSEYPINETLEFDILESADGTETPGTTIGTKDTAINIADDTVQSISLSSMTSGTNVLTKGRIYAFAIETGSTQTGDTNCTLVFKWDITT